MATKLLGLLLLLLGAPALAQADTKPILIFAAASISAAVEDAGRIYTQQQGHKIVVVPAASSVLARQIKEGAPADLFISANRAWVDYVIAHGMATASSVTEVAGNNLVVAAPMGQAFAPNTDISLERVIDKASRIAICDPAHVPCGIYAKQALTHAGLWARAADKMVYAANARTALAWVERGEVDAAFIYGSDALTSGNIAALVPIPTGWHSPIRYSAAPIATQARKPAVGIFLAFLRSAQGQKIFHQHGFTAVTGAPTLTP